MKMNYFPSTPVPVEQLSNSVVLSNSEIQSWHLCERRHFYAHVLKLEPKNYSAAIQRGFLGHEALAEFYEAMKDGKSKDECHKAAVAPIDNLLIPLLNDIKNLDTDKINMLSNLKSLVMQYVLKYYDEHKKHFNIIEVETVHIVPTPITGVQFGIKLDLLAEYTQPPYTGELVNIDHKFVKRFKNRDTIKLLPQIPRYQAVLRSDGFPVNRGTLNQLKHSATSDIFRKEPVSPTDADLTQIIDETFIVIHRILERISLPVEEQDIQALRTRSETVCGYCPFRKICTAESDHGSIFSERGQKNGMAKYFLDEHYRENTYGYTYEEDKADTSD